jgi:hypothetical protein
MRLSVQVSFRICKCFHRSKQDLCIYYFLQQGNRKNLKTIGTCTIICRESTDLIYVDLEKNNYLVNQSL